MERIKYIFFCILSVFLHFNTYVVAQKHFTHEDKIWQQIDSLEKQGNYRSALKIVDSLMSKVQKEDEIAIQVKILIYQLKLREPIQEDQFTHAILQIDSLKKVGSAPLVQILASIKAEMLWRYMQNNRYRFYERSQIPAPNLGDPSSWDLKTLLEQATLSFHESLENTNLLQKIELKEYIYIIENYEEQNWDSAPTLFDFLAHRALTFFENSETSIWRPAESFSLNNSSYFGPDGEFLSIPTNSGELISEHLQYVKIMQTLVNFHQNDSNPIARVRNNLLRLQFAYKNCNLTNDVLSKDELFENALRSLQKQYVNHSIFAEINAQLAQFYVQKSTLLSTTNDSTLIIAHKLCLEAMELYPNSLGAKQCESIKNSIEEQTIMGAIEKYCPQNKPLLAQVKYKNVRQIQLAVYRRSVELFEKSLDIQLKNAQLIHKQIIELPIATDFREHSTEIAIPTLPLGNYLVVYYLDSTKTNPKTDKIVILPTQITDLAYISNSSGKNQQRMWILNRDSGEPIDRATVKVKLSNNYTFKNAKETIYTSDKNGMVIIPTSKETQGMFHQDIKIVKGKDTLIVASRIYHKDTDNAVYFSDHLFTDRSIYRPGQTLYFKGIRLRTKGKNKEVVSHDRAEVSLLNANGKKVSTLYLTTNEYGSFSGEFSLPMGGLTGQFLISTQYGEYHFSVEEYKRPTFGIAFLASDRTYKLGDSITVKVRASAYADYPIDNAKASYVVKRLPQHNVRPLYYSPPTHAGEIVLQAETKTDKNGNFIIDFVAKKDRYLDKNTSYHYQIEVNVTDRNGETHSAQKTLLLGENDRFLNVKVDSILNKDTQNEILLSVVNCDAQAIKTQGVITIFQIETAKQFTRLRLWDSPDLPLLSRQEFDSLFPHLDFSPESKNERKTIKTIEKTTFDSEKDSVIVLQASKYPVGEYRIETIIYTSDKREIKDVKFTQITDVSAKKLPFTEILHVYSPVKTAQPGDTVSVYVNSCIDKQAIVMQIVSNNQEIQFEQFQLEKEQKRISFVVQAEHRGGLNFVFYTVKYGTVYTENIAISVPYSNKDLQVTFETFRNKLMPGSSEEWRLHISGANKESITSELLLSMYDASLDAFDKNRFYFSPFSENNIIPYYDYSGFGISHAYVFGVQTMYSPLLIISNIPKLNSFGYYLLADGRYHMRVMSASGRMRKQSNDSEKANFLDFAIEESALMDSDSRQSAILPDEIDNEQRIKNTIPVTIRKNFNETAFFHPHLESDTNGNIAVKFTVPEALTRWNILGLAHTKELDFATFTKELVTQKDVMIQANLPRFMRFGDTLFLTAKVSNLSLQHIQGTAEIELVDAMDQGIVNSYFQLVEHKQTIGIEGRKSEVVFWKIVVPQTVDLLTVRMSFHSDKHSDGEEHMVAIFSDKQLVTESLPITLNERGEHDFELTKLLESADLPPTRKHHAVTFEYSSDPKWYVIQSLPYLIETRQSNSIDLFSHFYANSLSHYLVSSFPKIKQVIEKWQLYSPELFLSELERNQELKTLVLEETPWVMEAENETEQKRRISYLFDTVQVESALFEDIRKLRKQQSEDGGFSWFEGMKSSPYITAYIVSGLGRLANIGAIQFNENEELWSITKRAVNYLDNHMLINYMALKKDNKLGDELSDWHIWSDYWYARSFFKQVKLSPQLQDAFTYFQEKTKDEVRTNFLSISLKSRVKTVLSFYRFGDSNTAKKYITAILELGIYSADQGLYWKQTADNFRWNDDPIETQTLIIEALHTILQDKKNADLAKIHLLSKKRTTAWHKATATANACYALLLDEKDLELSHKQLTIRVGNENISTSDLEMGYIKKRWSQKDISSDLGQVQIKQLSNHFSYGALYWQYFETIDNISSSATNLHLKKELFIVHQTSSGEQLSSIHDDINIRLGDKIRVRLEFSTDRALDFVHLCDYRASGFETVSVLSQHKWHDGLGYYENPRDASMHFFFDHLPKGSFVLEYDLFVEHIGGFSSGLAQIECMYAPEYRSTASTIRISVSE